MKTFFLYVKMPYLIQDCEEQCQADSKEEAAKIFLKDERLRTCGWNEESILQFISTSDE